MSFVSKKSMYGLSAMSVLSSQSKLIGIKEIATMSNVPQNFLEQILVSLKKANLTTSVRGSNGGYKLSKSSKEIRIYEIIEALEIDIFNIEDTENSVLNMFWNEKMEKVKEVFNTSLYELKEYENNDFIYHI